MTAPSPAVAGAHDFDFLVGAWRVHHRRLKQRLANNHDWVEFDGTSVARPLMDGAALVDDNVLHLPDGIYRAAGLRAFDAKSGLWSIWWLDGRSPLGPLEPPVRGRFHDGIGTFLADEIIGGQMVRVRFQWSRSPKRRAAGSRHSRSMRARRGRPTGRWTSKGIPALRASACSLLPPPT